MRAGIVSAAALASRNDRGLLPKPVEPRHCTEQEYASFVGGLNIIPAYRKQKLGYRRRFVERWPDLPVWFAAPLAERVGRLPGEDRHRLTCRVSYRARRYLLFLGLRGHARFDYAWLLAVGHLYVFDLARQLGLDLGVSALVEEAVRLGFNRAAAAQGMRWCVSRIALHRGVAHAREIEDAHVEELLGAVHAFGQRTDLPDYYGSLERYRDSPSKQWITQLHQLQTVLYHRGQLARQPRKVMPRYAQWPQVPPRMQRVVDRWLEARRLTDQPATVKGLELGLRRFLEWLCQHEPALESFAEVDRPMVLRYLKALAEEPLAQTGRPMALNTRIGRISALSMFFRQTADWGYDDVPGRPLLGPGDAPKRPRRVPRFIPEEELERLMRAVRQLRCPYQRAALLVARWSGARRDEIRRLEVDCLDAYPDGTPRLRLPAGKTFEERLVPLHEEAAAALRTVIALRTGRAERAFVDRLTGRPARYLFMEHGKLLSGFYLFTTSLRRVCEAAGLVDAQGRPTISAHRFRHTVGTQLAERGARLHTIMKVLGHRSASMSLVYAQLSDQTVLRDYQAVLGPGATIAGPAAEALRQRALSEEAVD